MPIQTEKIVTSYMYIIRLPPIERPKCWTFKPYCYKRNWFLRHCLWGKKSLKSDLAPNHSLMVKAVYLRNIAAFSEKTDVPHLPTQSMVAISVMKL